MAINTGNFAKFLWEGMNSNYGLAYNEYPEQCGEIFEKRTSRKAFEEIVGTAGFGMAPVKPEGSAVAQGTAQQGFVNRFQHIVYGLGFVITKEMIEDDLYDVTGQLYSKSLAKSMRITKETVAANVLNRASTDTYAGGDGVGLLSTAHPQVKGGTFANEPAAGTDLSEAALEDGCIALGKFEDDAGLRIATRPRKLIVPVDNQFEAERILNTDLRVSTANNDLNALKSLGKVPQGFAVNNYLTVEDSWYLLTDSATGLIQFERRADDFTQDNDHDTDNLKYKATGRYSFGWADGGRAVYGSMGA
jgi:hypothetical protein